MHTLPTYLPKPWTIRPPVRLFKGLVWYRPVFILPCDMNHTNHINLRVSLQEISTAVLPQLQYKKVSWPFTMRFCILITSFTDIALQFEGKLDFDPTFYFDRTFFVSLFFTGAWPDNLQIKETNPPCSNIIPTIRFTRHGSVKRRLTTIWNRLVQSKINE